MSARSYAEEHCIQSGCTEGGVTDDDVAQPLPGLGWTSFGWAAQVAPASLRWVSLSLQTHFAGRSLELWMRCQPRSRDEVACWPRADILFALEQATTQPGWIGNVPDMGCFDGGHLGPCFDAGSDRKAVSVVWLQRSRCECKATVPGGFFQAAVDCVEHFLCELPARAAYADAVQARFDPHIPNCVACIEAQWGPGLVRVDAGEVAPGEFEVTMRGHARIGQGRPMEIQATALLAFDDHHEQERVLPVLPGGKHCLPDSSWFGGVPPRGWRPVASPPHLTSWVRRPLSESPDPVLGNGYIIHLANQPDRLQNVCQLCALATDAGLLCRVVDAVDGRTFAAAETPVEGFWDYSRHPVRFREHMRPGEVGCLFSHCRAWARIAADTAPGGHVFEDDAVMAPYTFEVMRKAATALMGIRPPPMIFGDRGWPRAISWEDLEYEPQLPYASARRILCTKYCLAAYWISRGAARVLLRLLEARGSGGWLPSDDLVSIAAGVHLGLRTPEMSHLSPLRRGPLLQLFHTEPRTLLTLAVDYGGTESAGF